MGMALAQSGAGDPNVRRVPWRRSSRVAGAGVAHPGAQAADDLTDQFAHGSGVPHPALDTPSATCLPGA